MHTLLKALLGASRCYCGSNVERFRKCSTALENEHAHAVPTEGRGKEGGKEEESTNKTNKQTENTKSKHTWKHASVSGSSAGQRR
jgi:hypothetical protein